MRYKDKVVVVTGGSKGIGFGCVRTFMEEGGADVVFCARNAEEGEAVAAHLNARGAGRAHFIRADVSKVDEVRTLIDETVGKLGRLDCLINNAGWHPGHKPIDDFSVQDFRTLLDLNLVSIFAACKFALPHLRKTKGNIINISSLVGAMGQLHATTYVATKGAITALTKALAIDEAEHEVRVNSVSPGNVYTPLWQEAIDTSEDPAATRAAGEAAQLLGRMGTIEEAGRLCLYLAAEATFTTGVDHVLSGGAELGYGRKTRRG
ncbi:MAG TPA: SDR family NAD(P)-dependent oxidoreductase [Polyangia bacterium]|nr:SDR family NAD(P)-dependent oxidoreductase [Polyangia bacterium]